MQKQRVIIILGSRRDLSFATSIGRTLTHFGVEYEYRIASAHKTPAELLEILEDYERSGDSIVYVTVAGRSNALSGLVDANTRHPVIACPPYSEKFGGADIYSSLRTPSGVAPLVVLNPENAALAAVKMLGLENPALSEKVYQFQQKKKAEVNIADKNVKGKKVSEIEEKLKEAEQ
ncbi:MAG: AIR carboxylase family protein [Candidatus Bathyarchaeota archaeon]|nr:MAG: AIR carboxylase family protein [Candidatus Bathyarchaeota archaeon]